MINSDSKNIYKVTKESKNPENNASQCALSSFQDKFSMHSNKFYFTNIKTENVYFKM